MFPDVDQRAAMLGRRLAGAVQERRRLGRLPHREQMYLHHPAGGDFASVEDPDAVTPEKFKELVFLVEIHDSFAPRLVRDSRKLRLPPYPPMVEYILARSACEG